MTGTVDRWQLDESSAKAYERYLVPLFFGPGAQHLIELAALKGGERVLDVACGTGIVARTASEHVGISGTVIGIDLNEDMLEVARTASSNIHHDIEWRKGDVKEIPFVDSSFDVVFCQQGLQFFPDRLAALQDIHRVLKSNGRLALSTMRPIKHNPSYAILAEALERHIGTDAGLMMRSPFLFLNIDELRNLFLTAGFHDLRILIGIGSARYPSIKEFVLREAASSPLAKEIKSVSDDVFNALIKDLDVSLLEYTDDDGIVFPTEAYVAIAWH
jgi:ubiquinone/menaquinone biosynthesis C-methylase UbiE